MKEDLIACLESIKTKVIAMGMVSEEGALVIECLSQAQAMLTSCTPTATCCSEGAASCCNDTPTAA